MKKLGSYIAELESKRKKLQTMSISIVGVYVIALVVSFFNLIIASGIAACGIAFYFFVFRHNKKLYEASYSELNSMFGLGRLLDNFEYKKKGGLDYEELKNSNLVPIGGKENNFLCRQYVSGIWKGIKCELAEISAHYRYVTENFRDRYTFISGTWIKAVLNNPSDNDFIVVHNSFLHPFVYANHYKTAGYRELETSKKVLGQEYLIYVRQDVPRDYMPLNEDCIKKFIALTEKINYALAFSVNGSNANIFLYRRYYTDKILIKYEINEERLCLNRLPELEPILKLVRICGK